VVVQLLFQQTAYRQVEYSLSGLAARLFASGIPSAPLGEGRPRSGLCVRALIAGGPFPSWRTFAAFPRSGNLRDFRSRRTHFRLAAAAAGLRFRFRFRRRFVSLDGGIRRCPSQPFRVDINTEKKISTIFSLKMTA
jgi:hypothetical protein